LGGDAISNDGAFDVGDDGLDVGLVNAQDGGAVERYAIDELREGVLDVFEGVILIEMLASMVVTTATTGASSRKVRSLSSASTTKYSPLRGGQWCRLD